MEKPCVCSNCKYLVPELIYLYAFGDTGFCNALGIRIEDANHFFCYYWEERNYHE